jgi:hypothetical protein
MSAYGCWEVVYGVVCMDVPAVGMGVVSSAADWSLPSYTTLQHTTIKSQSLIEKKPHPYLHIY